MAATGRGVRLDYIVTATSVPNRRQVALMKEWSLIVTLSVALSGSLLAAQARSARCLRASVEPALRRMRGGAAGDDDDSCTRHDHHLRQHGRHSALSTSSGLVRFPWSTRRECVSAGKAVDRLALKSLTGPRGGSVLGGRRAHHRRIRERVREGRKEPTMRTPVCW